MDFGAIIGAGSSLLGGLLGDSSEKKAYKRQKKLLKKQYEYQKEFARKGIQWKVMDARDAGIHPLYALGANTVSYTPQSVGDVGGNSLGAGIASAGQELGRSISASSSAQDRTVQDRMQTLGVKRMELENELLESQINGSRIANLRQAGGNPAMPVPGQKWLLDGQGQTPLYEPQPFKPTASAPGAGFSEPGPITWTGYAQTPTGLSPVPSDDVAQRIEDNILMQAEWYLRNRIAPVFGSKSSRPPTSPGAGNEWSYDPLNFEWVKVKRSHGASGAW